MKVSFEGRWVPLLICEPDVAVGPHEVEGVALQPRITRLRTPGDHVEGKPSLRAYLGKPRIVIPINMDLPI
jgi:hypothetical protein